jgi:hypothetical protein
MVTSTHPAHFGGRLTGRLPRDKALEGFEADFKNWTQQRRDAAVTRGRLRARIAAIRAAGEHADADTCAARIETELGGAE